jgi:hypothetical protein
MVRRGMRAHKCAPKRDERQTKKHVFRRNATSRRHGPLARIAAEGLEIAPRRGGSIRTARGSLCRQSASAPGGGARLERTGDRHGAPFGGGRGRKAYPGGAGKALCAIPPGRHAAGHRAAVRWIARENQSGSHRRCGEADRLGSSLSIDALAGAASRTPRQGSGGRSGHRENRCAHRDSRGPGEALGPLFRKKAAGHQRDGNGAAGKSIPAALCVCRIGAQLRLPRSTTSAGPMGGAGAEGAARRSAGGRNRSVGAGRRERPVSGLKPWWPGGSIARAPA